MRLPLLPLSGLFCLSAWLSWACSGSHEKSNDHAGPVAGPTVRPRLVLDVPALVGASIDALPRTLGRPQRVPAHLADPAALERAGGPATDSAVAFQRPGVLVVATFNLRTRQVSDLLLVGRREDTLMQQANLDPEAANYLVVPVFDIHNTSQFLGLRVIPKLSASRQ